MAGLIDAHCHLDSERLDASADALIAEARAVGVDAIVMAGVDSASIAAQAAIEARHPGVVFRVLGLHPQMIPCLSDDAVAAELRALEDALAASRPVALGETGLDALTPETRAALPRQRDAFRAQLALARAADLPVVLHLLRADADALAVLKADGLPRAGGVVHAFSGSAEFARALVRLGLHLSFCGTLTLPTSRRIREAALAFPAERLLVETDSPDQTPWPARPEGPEGRRRPTPNRPAFLPHVARALAETRGLTFDGVAALTAANARRLLGLPSPAPRD